MSRREAYRRWIIEMSFLQKPKGWRYFEEWKAFILWYVVDRGDGNDGTRLFVGTDRLAAEWSAVIKNRDGHSVRFVDHKMVQAWLAKAVSIGVFVQNDADGDSNSYSIGRFWENQPAEEPKPKASAAQPDANPRREPVYRAGGVLDYYRVYDANGQLTGYENVAN